MTTSFPATLKSNLFTIKEANFMVPLFKTIGEDIINAWSDIVQYKRILDSVENVNTNLIDAELVHDLEETQDKLHVAVDKMNAYIGEIEELGCTVSEFHRGIIVIPSLLEGRKIFLCYRSGEDSVQDWQELGEAYSQKKDIVTNKDFYWG